MIPTRTSTRYERLLTEDGNPSSYNSMPQGLLSVTKDYLPGTHLVTHLIISLTSDLNYHNYLRTDKTYCTGTSVCGLNVGTVSDGDTQLVIVFWCLYPWKLEIVSGHM